MSQTNSELDRNLDTLFEIGRQRAAVVREFDRATFAQIAQVQELIENDPRQLEHYRSILIRGERITTASKYLASLNIPGYDPQPMDGVDETERDRAAIILSIFAPQDPEFLTWVELTGFEIEKALGRLGMGTLAPVSVSSIEQQTRIVEQTADTNLLHVEEDIPAVDAAEVVSQVLYDDVVLHLTDEARRILLVCSDAGEPLTVGRIRKRLGEGFAEVSSSEIVKLIQQVNREFAKNYEGELIEIQGGGWYRVSPANTASISTQDVLVKVTGRADDNDDEPVIETAERAVIDVKYKGKRVVLGHSFHYAILKSLIDAGMPINAEALLANEMIRAYEVLFPGDKLKDALRDGIFAVQQHFESEYGVSISIDRTGAKLPNEFSRHEGVLLIEGMRRGRKYSISPSCKQHLSAEVLLNRGEVSTDNRPQEEIEAERMDNLRKISVRVYSTLHSTQVPLSLTEVANILIHAEFPGGASKTTLEGFTDLVFAGFNYLLSQQGLFGARNTRLKTQPPIEGDPLKYQIVDIEPDTVPPAHPMSASDRLAERRSRLADVKGVTEDRAQRVMDDKNRLYATHAIVDGQRVAFSEHEAAIVVILNSQPGKTPIDISKITRTLRSSDSSVTRGDVEIAISGLGSKLRAGWLIEEKGPKGKAYRFGKNVGIKTHNR